jgi:hypothetical protein
MVKLGEGTFYRNDWSEGYDFEGYFKGAGMDRTYLVVDEPIDFAAWRDIGPGLITFRRGNIHMSHMSIDIQESHPVENFPLEFIFQKALTYIINFTGASSADPDFGDSEIDSFVEHIGLYSGEGGFFGVNVLNVFSRSPEYAPDFSLPYKIVGGGAVLRNSKIIGGGAAVAFLYTDGRFYFDNNHIENAWYGIELADLSDSFARITRNHIKSIYLNPDFFGDGFSGIILTQGLNTDVSNLDKSRFIIANNHISDLENAYGIYALDRAVGMDGQTIQLWAYGNKIKANKDPENIGFPGMTISAKGSRINGNLLMGYPGWSTGIGAVEFSEFTTENYFGYKNRFPGSSLCNQVQDLGDNLIVGWEDCE